MTDVRIRPLRFPDEVATLHALVAVCHPTRKARPDDWWFLHPTIVATAEGVVVGYASLVVNPLTRMLTLMDCGVAPDARGQGLAGRLMAYRMELGREFGCTLIAGAVAPDNEPMRRVVARAGLREVVRVPDYYAEETPPRDGLVLVGQL
ncbi:MAG TPA: GNAT family N-acetyltransferase [Candidatus Limnocylindrales bacterium]|nr:GNAT family N-acetyltransferase [Candidatus Limnocylindrales bacterium]